MSNLNVIDEHIAMLERQIAVDNRRLQFLYRRRLQDMLLHGAPPEAGPRGWKIEEHGSIVTEWRTQFENMTEARARDYFEKNRKYLNAGFGMRLVDPAGQVIKIAPPNHP